LGGLLPRPPPEGLPVVLGALCGLAMIFTCRLVLGIGSAGAYLAFIVSADFRSIYDFGGAREVSRYGKFYMS